VSKTLGLRLRGLSTYQKEYVAILLVVEQWRPYLQFQEFTIATDHKSLSHLNEQRLHTQWQQKVFTKLLSLHYKIVYKKGVNNRVADALSRMLTHVVQEAACHALTVCHPKWIEYVETSYASNPHVNEIIAKLMVDANAIPHLSWAKGILKYKSRIWIGEDQELRNKLLEACHSSAMGGHSRVHVTYRRMKQVFA
jgi:hypothetical protein